MIRKLFLGLTILAVVFTPRPAHGHGGTHGGHHHHHLGPDFVGLGYAPFPYGSLCWDGHWIDQFSMDRGCGRTRAAGPAG
jgi:hypothetical protein